MTFRRLTRALFVIAGPDPAIHRLNWITSVMDARVKPAHDDSTQLDHAPAPASGTFSLVPASGTWAPYFSPSFTLGTVSLTSVIGRPWVGAMVLTPSRSIRWSRRSQ